MWLLIYVTVPHFYSLSTVEAMSDDDDDEDDDDDDDYISALYSHGSQGQLLLFTELK